MHARAAEVVGRGGTAFWWRGQGGSGTGGQGRVVPESGRQRLRSSWVSKLQARLPRCMHGAATCNGVLGNWSAMCAGCRGQPEVRERDPCLCAQEGNRTTYLRPNQHGTVDCYGPNDTRGKMCAVCIRSISPQDVPRALAVDDGRVTAVSAQRENDVGRKRESASKTDRCAGCLRIVSVCRRAFKAGIPPQKQTELCRGCI